MTLLQGEEAIVMFTCAWISHLITNEIKNIRTFLPIYLFTNV